MPNWCANRLYFYGEEADIAGIRNLLSGELISHFLRAEQEGIQLFVAGCAGILRPVEDFTYAPFPALTQAGKGSNSPENIAFSRWLTSLQEQVELNKDNCHLLVSVSSRPSFIFFRVSYHGHFREHGHYRGQKYALQQKTLDFHSAEPAI
ncbi:DUF1281 domain-containing protein [Klebsiella aerogenes]|nr:DUF1281 domain-containing protein [Klebsiella aerogenes]